MAVKLHSTGSDIDYNDIPAIKVPVPKGNIAKSKISDIVSSYVENGEIKYYDISFELLNDTTQLFILPDKKGYWPDTALMIRRDRVNNKFSLEDDYYLYKGE